MKKKTKIIICIVIFVMILSIGSAYCILKGAGDKHALSLDEFKQIAEEKGYLYEDATTDSIDRYGKMGIVTLGEEMYVGLYELKNENDSQGIFLISKNDIQKEKQGKSSETNISTEHYEKYTLNSRTLYWVCIRVDNTILTSTVSESNRDILDNFIKEIGY